MSMEQRPAIGAERRRTVAHDSRREEFDYVVVGAGSTGASWLAA